ncbi:uncharacterized protein LOC124256370 [Haliotis rubra]|uniref:uncharacterized protein LOC124256370 n=1 Tax=Haliotis rubra TaxID=36100 RepID=UPI001EE5DFC8|nr:uncharacterized protein LOC124256370 [Haliotis rubra]
MKKRDQGYSSSCHDQNEQRYSEVIDVLDAYEDLVKDVYEKIPVQDSQKTVKKSHNIKDGCTIYAHNFLELGLLFKELSDAIHCPDRIRMISILKLAMLVCKGSSTKSKYALEILRFLCHQLATLSEKVANESFYGCFVNTGGKVDTHIAADMAMEHLVRNVKSHIQALHSNKSEKTIKKRTGAFAGLSTICENFDRESDMIIRAHKHKSPSADKDEMMLFDNIHRMKPFSNQNGRPLGSHSSLSNSLISKLTRHQLQSWISGHQVNFKHEIGQ